MKECCKKVIEEIESWLKERTMINVLKNGEIKKVQFMPFEWEDLKTKMMGK